MFESLKNIVLGVHQDIEKQKQNARIRCTSFVTNYCQDISDNPFENGKAQFAYQYGFGDYCLHFYYGDNELFYIDFMRNLIYFDDDCERQERKYSYPFVMQLIKAKLSEQLRRYG